MREKSHLIYQAILTALKSYRVASSLDAIGTSKVDLLVQSDLINNPNLPLCVAPNEEFTVPGTI